MACWHLATVAPLATGFSPAGLGGDVVAAELFVPSLPPPPHPASASIPANDPARTLELAL